MDKKDKTYEFENAAMLLHALYEKNENNVNDIIVKVSDNELSICYRDIYGNDRVICKNVGKEI